jgi:hypothetical protein
VIWAPGGRAATSDTATVPSGRRNHSMWVSPVRSPRAVSAAGAMSLMPAYSGPPMSRGSSTIHCIHGLRSTSSGVGR